MNTSPEDEKNILSQGKNNLKQYNVAISGLLKEEREISKRAFLKFALVIICFAVVVAATYYIAVVAILKNSLNIALYGDNIIIFGQTFSIQFWVWIIPAFIFDILMLKTVGWTIKKDEKYGFLFKCIGKWIAYGIPSLGISFQWLHQWYNEDKNHNEELIDIYIQKGGLKEDLNNKSCFASWVIAEVLPKYENNVQAFAYWGAGILIFLIGLRGIKLWITREDPSWLLVGLEFEAFVLFLLGLLLFYSPERHLRPPIKIIVDTEKLAEEFKKIKIGVQQPLEVKISPDTKIESTIK